jgi:hypothetical protein
MVDTIKGILEKIITEKSYYDTFFSPLVMTIFDESFDKKVDEIRRNSSSQAQYNRDLVVKRKIQKATTYFKIIEESGNLIKYMDGAIKKDRRLFNFEYTDKNNLFRFRVLRDGDPYHFSVGVDTACCQRIGGAGENAAIDSFQNPLAGVLLLEFNINSSWVTGAQSYFHYVPKQNGIILDNVETNNSNCSKFFANKNYTLKITKTNDELVNKISLKQNLFYNINLHLDTTEINYDKTFSITDSSDHVISYINIDKKNGIIKYCVDGFTIIK